MATLTFDPASFRAQCPAYADAVAYPDATLQGLWNQAVQFISASNTGRLTDDGRRMAINWYTAHLLYLQDLILGGTAAGIVTSSGVGATSLSLEPPLVPNQYKWWINLSPYGQAAAALLKTRSIGGFSIGMTGPRAGVRQPNGQFLGQ